MPKPDPLGLKRQKKKELWEQQISNKKKLTPVAFLLKQMWNKSLPMDQRIRAAVDVAPYVHSKMPRTIEVETEINYVPPFLPPRKGDDGD